MATIMAIGAHPDDLEIGIGGTLHKAAQNGHTVIAVDLTDGELTPYGTRETRAKETAEANRHLNISERICLDLPNRVLMDSEDARTKLAIEMRRTRPDVIFTHLDQDMHPDHVASYQITRGAVLLSRIVKCDLPHEPWRPGRLYSFVCSHLKHVYQPSFVLQLTPENFEAKMAAILAYESQFGSRYGGLNWMREHITARAQMYGALIGQPYAEAILTDEVIGVEDIFDLSCNNGGPTIPK